MHTCKAYQAQWRAIKQTHGQTEQELANKIKEVYEDANPHKDNRTKKEELLSKFLEALADPEQRYAVEYTKDPTSLDEAVEFALLYRQTKRMQRSNPDPKRA